MFYMRQQCGDTENTYYEIKYKKLHLHGNYKALLIYYFILSFLYEAFGKYEFYQFRFSGEVIAITLLDNLWI